MTTAQSDIIQSVPGILTIISSFFWNVIKLSFVLNIQDPAVFYWCFADAGCNCNANVLQRPSSTIFFQFILMVAWLLLVFIAVTTFLFKVFSSLPR